MSYSLRFEYLKGENNSPSIRVFLTSESIFKVGGFTLKPRFEYINLSEIKPVFKAIQGANGFFASSNLAESVISSISPAGVESQQREERNGYWVHLANYLLEEEAIDNISIETEILEGDFFLASGENIAPEATSISIKTQEGNAEGLIQIQGDFVQGEALEAIAEINDPEGVGDLKYTWYRSKDGQSEWEIKEETNHSKYTPDQEDVGYHFKVNVSYIDKLGTKERLSSSISTVKIQN